MYVCGASVGFRTGRYGSCAPPRRAVSAALGEGGRWEEGGLVPPLQKAFADAQNETRREHEAVAQRVASPGRAGAGAGAKR